jgi:outer membrane protein assembly factor BamB
MRYTGDITMPPTKPLTAAQVAALAKWIAEGAAWPAEKTAGRNGGITESDRRHWAFRPIADPPAPTVHDTAWSLTDVDRFVLAPLEAAGVIQNCDAANQGLLAAFDKSTGMEKWRTPRTAPERGGWTTPVLAKVGDQQELVLNGEKAVTAYDPATGKELWRCSSFSGRGEPTVTQGAGGLLFVVSGQPGDIFAIRPGGRDDVTKTHMACHTPRKSGRDQPSPILAGNFMVVADMAGVATCYDAPTGKALWSDRLKGAYSSSPVAVGRRVFFQNEVGVTTVIEPGPELNVVAENTLGVKGEVFRASLIPCAGHWFTRSDKAAYCIEAK